jgi:hypothetical protein
LNRTTTVTTYVCTVILNTYVNTIKNSNRDDGLTKRDKGEELEIIKSDGI